MASATPEGFSFGSDGGPFTVDSNAFTKPVTLKEQKSGYSGTATLRCDIKPGTYAVELAGPDITAHDLDHGGRGTVKVYPGDDAACAHPKRRAQATDTHRDDGGPSTAVLAASAAGTALLGAAAGYTAGRRRNR
ncbi:hypothetical protein [Streptomyces sp. NPDC050355]|uniref:hypothetical protein n=1 Tax=Streptomyces sp. NPDC050355 TaxID=3365609 RepID=UPI00379AF6A6